ncbi:histidine utilization repressor [Halomonas daqingensis]|uniref:Histidine utilization repressor n=1 Tax=Billgrantia desiderata TaxID=52021 RepID=A0AAW4YRJ3_9GAMM|nr:histidine utilization repressor [Halomonas desiderata]MCE8012561.1 histidine utilization repressor [Halomonas desiderata]MCE8027388.1 histidine utilization repressor [Halomonas desiderata]MCE8041061.1 histidine utilization repressor [Halomonas desiderata]MCE8045636.1 histidine utilization repressor [Halomonas desiderata]MCE8051034.1 histidine utilization repressor [Halomonas desiderata]
MGSTIPLYLQIQQHLLEKIRSGTWPAHHQIPPEEQLARDFGVSRMTANKAIRDLVQQGYLTRQPGLGTFVTDRKAESSLVDVHNIAEEVRGRGHRYECDVLLAEAIAADDEVALRLGVRLGTRVFHTRIVHRENGVPIQLEDRFVNPRWVPDYLETDFHRHTPNEVLVAACPITDVEHVVEAVRVDATTAERLEMDATQPCLSMIRRTWSGEHLISYARLIHPGDRYKLRSALSRRAS